MQFLEGKDERDREQLLKSVSKDVLLLREPEYDLLESGFLELNGYSQDPFRLSKASYPENPFQMLECALYLRLKSFDTELALIHTAKLPAGLREEILSFVHE
jgi:hypothetical protein